MSDSLLIKGNKYGLTIILDEQATFDNIKETLIKKITDAKKFFKDAKVAITFSGRELTDGEQQELIAIITSHSDMEVVCVMEDNKQKQQESIDTTSSDNGQMAVFHRGTLRSGQELNVENSVIIIGDVNPGAKVSAGGNVIVLGSLKGTVITRACNGRYPFIVALSMDPMQLRIGDIIGRSSDQLDDSDEQSKTQIAYVEEGRICIEPLNRNIYNELDYFEQDFKIN
ncbi:septum site-determining protein MinC [Vallitalea pronyensis]|uniref:Probable septum site-determining protein MinC n=1 Tax=Vallitalea pronyensis TaxID=1348613 RepID=A0A8J8SH87_9FIRM|nr:septum site-determining protein MinC [Vallitalea pronyensis]QUI23336.1 septum site-determining protein MinC [Vallitalea pronyensis]